MYLLISILAVIISIVLVFFVVIQNSKGGGLAAGFSGSNQVMGVRKTTDFLEKATWTLAGLIVVCSIAASYFMTSNTGATNDSSIKEDIQNALPLQQNQNAVPDFGTPVPAATNGTGTPAAAPAKGQESKQTTTPPPAAPAPSK